MEHKCISMNDIKELFERVTMLERTSDRYDEKLDNMISKLDVLSTKVDNIAGRPQENYNAIKLIILTALITSMVTLVVGAAATGLVYLIRMGAIG